MIACFDRSFRGKCLIFAVVLCLAFCGCNWFSKPNVTGTWKGTLSSDKSNPRWNAPAELTLSQQDHVITGSLVFSHPEAGSVQIPIFSGVISGDQVVLSGRAPIVLGSVELTVHGKIAGSMLTGDAALTSRVALLGSHIDRFALQLKKQ